MFPGLLPSNEIVTLQSALVFGAGAALVIVCRSAIILGLAFGWLRLSGFARRHLVFRLPYADGQLISELRAAVPVVMLDVTAITVVVGLGWLPLAEPTLGNSVATFALLFVWFELWFYATHRILHTPAFYFIHRQHHVATVVDPLTSLSFSMLERLILIVGALGFVVLLSQVAAVSGPGLAVYGLVNYSLNVLGHSNVEVFPSGFARSAVGRWIVTPTYHALHHARYRGHYGLFTVVLDRAFGSVFPDYAAVQERAGEGDGLTRAGERLKEPLVEVGSRR